MTYISNCINFFKLFFLVTVTASMNLAVAADILNTDYLSIEQGAIPVAIGNEAKKLKVGMDRALLAIDGNAHSFGLTPKPGGPDSEISFIFQLPALTRFTDFAVSNILETPSPSQTFVRTIEVAGSAHGLEGPFHVLASATLKTHSKKSQVTPFTATVEMPVRWVRLTMRGGIDIQRDRTFFEFSEIIGHGKQEPIPLLKTFTGKWKGRGVLLELIQDGVRVNGCYDRVGHLTGTVDGNLLRATGKSRSDIPSTFVLTVTDNGNITGVRSTNGAPFRLYAGQKAPRLKTKCSKREIAPLGCGSIVHGIHFDFDSATIRPESFKLLNTLSAGLKATKTSGITVIGHTSSEGADAYNEKLSQRRAEAIVTALIERGNDATKISPQGRGEKQPIADNATGAGRSLNRRVEIECH